MDVETTNPRVPLRVYYRDSQNSRIFRSSRALNQVSLASFLSKSHVKLFAISLHNNFVVQLSEWKVNSAVPDVLPVSPVILMERQESWDGSVQFMVSVGLPHISPLLKLGAHSWHSMAKAVKEKK